MGKPETGAQDRGAERAPVPASLAAYVFKQGQSGNPGGLKIRELMSKVIGDNHEEAERAFREAVTSKRTVIGPLQLYAGVSGESRA